MIRTRPAKSDFLGACNIQCLFLVGSFISVFTARRYA